MLILDENVNESQRLLFLRRKFHIRQVGIEIAHKGTSDADLLRLLVKSRRATFQRIIPWYI